MRMQTKKLTVIAMLCAVAYLVMVVGRIPIVMFLKYDPKDVVLAIGGFFYGPLIAAVMSAIVCIVEMFTVSDTGFIGLVMNALSSFAFACTAAYIYKKKRDIQGAAIGLIAGCLLMTAVMLLWNYFITPLYLGYPRQAVAEMLVPVFLPFNLLKSGLNAAVTMLLYKPLSNALHKSRLMPAHVETNAGSGKINIGAVLISAFVIVSCVLLILVWQGQI